MARVILYEEIFEQIAIDIIKEYNYRYDYYYHVHQLNRLKTNRKIDTIITGSSYGLWNIDESILPNAANLSLGTQDLYYSIKGILNACKYNNIKRIVFVCAYYFFHSDLSMSKNQYNLLEISKIYQPIYSDVHNACFIPPAQKQLSDSTIFDASQLLDIYIESRMNCYYFNEAHPREKRWEIFSDEERNNNASERATSHNRSINYLRSFEENKMIFNEFMDYCMEKGMKMFVASIPTTKQYRESLNPMFKTLFYKTLNESRGLIHLIDLCDSEMFVNGDYFDADHLNEKGALKFTRILFDEICVETE